MEKAAEKYSELNVRKLVIRIILAFIAGVTVVLLTTFYAYHQVQKIAIINTELDEITSICRNQNTLSQYVTKRALLLNKDSVFDNENIHLLDSSLTLFQLNHQEIETGNRRLDFSGLDIFKVDSLYFRLSPSVSALIRSSYGIQEASNVGLFRSNILKHEETFLPAMNLLIDEYQLLSRETNQRLDSSITSQYWMIGISVIIAASLVLIFTVQLVKVRVLKQRKHFKEVLGSKERYERVVNGTHDIIYELDANGAYTYINPAFEKFIGFSLEEINRINWFDNVIPEKRSEVVAYYTDVIKNKVNESYYEFPITTARGEVKWVGLSADFTFDEHGRIKHVYNVAKDITDLKSSTGKEEKYKQGVRLLNELNGSTDLSIQQRMNQGLKLCLEYLGLETAIISSIWMDEYRISAFYPETSELEINQKFKLGDTYCDITLAQKGKVLGVDKMSDSVHKGHPCFEQLQFETYIGAAYRVDGKIFGTVNFTGTKSRKEPFTTYELDFISLVARWVGDLVEQQQSSNKILEEQNLLKTFISGAPAAIAMLDKHMNYISASKRWYKDQNIVGDIIGKSHYKIFPSIPVEWKKMHQRALEGEIVKPGIEKFVRADGGIQWVQGEIHPWYTSKDKVGGIIIFTNDLTEVKRQEVELRKAKDEAEDASRIKEQFLSTMSHEIRTPLNAIIGTTNLLEMEHPELENSNRLKMLKFGSNNLLTLINDILDFQKIESGNLEIVEEDVNLNELVKNIIETWKSVPQLGNGQVQLKYSYADALADYFICDGIRLTQILNNLVSNAIKFTEKGKVELSVEPGGEGVLQFTIKDTGIGIPEDKLSTIFETFKQVNNSYTSKVGGTGLGLSISKHLVDLMGGKLEVVSSLGKGTTFYFSLPFEKSQIKTTRKKQSKQDKNNLDLHVLLVEDNQANQEIAKGFLNRWGVTVDLANHGEEALDMIASKAYDLMIIDVRMPIMDGYEATRRIRAMNDEYFRKLPIIALTASTLLESRSKMERSGMNEIVSKPFDPEDLFEKVSRLGNRSFRKILARKKPVRKNEEETPFAFLHELLGGETEKVMMIADMAIKSIGEGIVGAREMMGVEDRERAYDHLHKMKSNLANIDLQKLAAKMPDYRSDTFWKKLPNFLDRVEEEIDKKNELLINA
ncbi:ATP-binding protein [Ekhidna sp.]